MSSDAPPRPPRTMRLRVTRRPRMDRVLVDAHGIAVALTLVAMVLVLDEAGAVDAEEVSDLLRTEPPMHPDPVASVLAQDMVNLVALLLTASHAPEPER